MFEDFVKHIAKWEGGYSNDPLDRGGETVRGITWGTYQTIGPKLGFPATKERFLKLTFDDFAKFVKYFWDRSSANEIRDKRNAAHITQLRWGNANRIPQFLNKIFAAKGIQDRVPSDTLLTKQNIKNINSLNQDELFDTIHKLKMDHYEGIIRNDPSQSRFRTGWQRRANDFYNTFKKKTS